MGHLDLDPALARRLAAEIIYAELSARPLEALRRLRNRLRRYCLEHALGFLNRLYITFTTPALAARLPRAEREYWPRNINAHQLAYIAKTLIQESDDSRPQTLTFDEYRECANLYNAGQGGEMPGGADLRAWHGFFLRLAHQQLRLQMDPWALIPRTLKLYQDIAARPELAGDFDIPGALKKLMGMTVEEFLILGFWVYERTAFSISRPAFFELADFVTTDRPIATQQNVAAFLELCSTDYPGFQQRCAEAAPSRTELEPYAFNPLEARPIIRTRSGRYVVPYPPFLLDRITIGLYYDLVPLHKEAFASTLGRAFEIYVGELLATVYGPDRLFSERRYGKPEKRSSDWIVVEGDSAVLIECKITRLTMATKVSADFGALKADLSRNIVRALRQLQRVKKDIESGEPGLEDFAHVTRFLPVVMVLDPFIMGNRELVRELVGEQMPAEAPAELLPYQIISVDEIERSLPAIERRGFAKLLLDKMADSQNPLQSTAYWDFRRYVASVAPDEAGGDPNPVLVDSWRRFREAARVQFPEIGKELPALLREPSPQLD